MLKRRRSGIIRSSIPVFFYINRIKPSKLMLAGFWADISTEPLIIYLLCWFHSVFQDVNLRNREKSSWGCYKPDRK